MDLIAIISIVLGVLSVYISIKANKEAKEVNHQTEIQLIEIKNTANMIYNTSNKIEENIMQQMNKVINNLLPTQAERVQKEMIHELYPLIYQNPELLKKILK